MYWQDNEIFQHRKVNSAFQLSSVRLVHKKTKFPLRAPSLSLFHAFSDIPFPSFRALAPFVNGI